MKDKCRLYGWILTFLTAVFILSPFSMQAAEDDAAETDYTVSFVDKQDYEKKIFNTQRGSVPEGTVITISFPEQIVGNDGHIWKSVEESPREIEIYQSGTHKYYIEYRQGGQMEKPEGPEAEAEERLETWLQTAWKADCAITGSSSEESGAPIESYQTVSDTVRNNSRIKNLVSMINDAEWHYFYMIGKNYTPQTLVIGTAFAAEYSSVIVDTFSIGKDRYTVLRVGVLRKWNAKDCVHQWENATKVENTCLLNGRATYCCEKCSAEQAVLLPALGHADMDKDSLCDRCLKRAFSQKKGDRIQTILRVGGTEIPLAFTCMAEDYDGTGKMLYLADSVLGSDITGTCFTDGNAYEESEIRRYFEYGFSNDSSLAPALQAIVGKGGTGFPDYAALLSREEYETYAAQGLLAPSEPGYFLRTSAGAGEIYAVRPDGAVTGVSAAGNTGYGARPFILLDKPDTDDKAEPYIWKEGEVQARQIGSKTYLFRCVDEDYSDNQSNHRKAALFLCDTVIRSDVDSDSGQLKKLSFGTDNNYKRSNIRTWLNTNAADSHFNLESIYIGVSSAYTGSTKARTFEQMNEEQLTGHDIGFQLIKDRLFCLSAEEALKYKHCLWRFYGSEENNPDTQISPYSAGYYLRTPFYWEDTIGAFGYSDDVYVVDLEQGNIHTAKTGSTAIGIRPAFALPQGQN